MLFSTETLFESRLYNLQVSFLDTILKRLEVRIGGGGERTFKLNTVDLSFV